MQVADVVALEPVPDADLQIDACKNASLRRTKILYSAVERPWRPSTRLRTGVYTPGCARRSARTGFHPGGVWPFALSDITPALSLLTQGAEYVQLSHEHYEERVRRRIFL